MSSEGLIQRLQQDSSRQSLQLPLQRTRPLPEPQLVSQPPSVLTPTAHSANHLSFFSPPGWNYLHHRPTQVIPKVVGLPWHKPNILYESPPPTQLTSVLPSFSQPSPAGTPAPGFSPPLYPFYHSQPPLLSPPMASQETQLALPSPSPTTHSQPMFPVAHPQFISPHLVYPHPHNSHN